jgi:hypothetical protein
LLSEIYLSFLVGIAIKRKMGFGAIYDAVAL